MIFKIFMSEIRNFGILSGSSLSFNKVTESVIKEQKSITVNMTMTYINKSRHNNQRQGIDWLQNEYEARRVCDTRDGMRPNSDPSSWFRVELVWTSLGERRVRLNSLQLNS